MSLATVLQEIKQIKPFAEEDISSGPMETLNSRRGRQKQAKETLKRLKKEYMAELLSTAVFVVSSGLGKDSFASVAVESFNCFSADPEEFYKDLVNRVPPVLYLNKEGINAFDVLGRHLEDKMLELDIREYNQLITKQEYSKKVESKEEFIELVKQAINKQIGAEIVGIQSVTSLIDTALDKGHSGRTTPIILSTNDEKLALDLIRDLERLTKRVFLVITGKSSKSLKSVEEAIILKEANKETVEQALITIQKSLKK